MPTATNDSSAIDWILRIGVAIQCAGYAWLLGIVNESPLMGWLWEPEDVGGLALGERVALVIVKALAVLMCVAAISTLCRPSRLVLLGVVLVQIAFAVATWQTYDGFPLNVAWLGVGHLRAAADAVVPLFPFAAQAARIAAPLVLILVHWSRLRKLLGVAITPISERILRIALMLTFAAHGLEALQRRGIFLDFLILAHQNLLGVRISESTAAWLLLAIGTIDLVLAVLVVTTRWRGVAAYMAAWGFVTAAARVVVLGVDAGWYEFAIRSAHWTLPLVLVLAWRLSPAAETMVESKHN